MPKKKFLIGGVFVFLAIAYLGYIGFGASATYYFTVSELIEKGDSIYGENVRVNGQVAPGSIDWDSKSRLLRFTLADEEESVSVVYEGIVPDTFKAGNDVVVEGKLNPEGIFRANIILTKCPSRYTPEK